MTWMHSTGHLPQGGTALIQVFSDDQKSVTLSWDMSLSLHIFKS